MLCGQSFGRNQVDIFLDLDCDCLPILFKRRELPLQYLRSQLWPKLEQFFVPARFGIDYVSSGGHGEPEPELMEPRTYSFKRNRAAVRLDFMAAGKIIVVRGI